MHLILSLALTVLCNLAISSPSHKFPVNISTSFPPYQWGISREASNPAHRVSEQPGNSRTNLAQQGAVEGSEGQGGCLPSPQHAAGRAVPLDTAHFQPEELPIISGTNHQVLPFSADPTAQGRRAGHSSSGDKDISPSKMNLNKFCRAKSLDSYPGPTNSDTKLLRTRISYSRSESHTITLKNPRYRQGPLHPQCSATLRCFWWRDLR